MSELPLKFVTRTEQTMEQNAEAFLKSLNTKSPTSIRLHPFKSSVLDSLPSVINWNHQGRYLEERPSFTMDPYFHAGAYYVQEASSMALQQALISTELPKSPRVLDLCAAPGGKTTLTADFLQLQHGFDYVLMANEVIKSRANILGQNMTKWGYSNQIITSLDPRYLANKLEGYFDLVIADCPCSGEGLFRKDTSARDEWSEDNVRLCDLRQKRIVEEAAKLLRPGGYMIYSTCTYNDYENIDQVSHICQELGFQSIPLGNLKEWAVEEIQKNGEFGYQFYPHKLRGEGFFISLVRKKGNSSQQPASLKRTPKQVNIDQLRMPEELCTILYKNELYYSFPSNLLEQFMWLDGQLPIRSMGTPLGRIIKAQFIPEHDLAMSCFTSANYESLKLDKEQAISFLKKQDFSIPQERGWRRVEYEGLGIGWIKLLGNRANNYLPMNIRILKA